MMQEDLSNYRKSYQKNELLETTVALNPMQQFQKWFYEVKDTHGVEEPNAMTIATIGMDGFPKSRVVLMKKFGNEGFVFYTNYKSEKGVAIDHNPNVCLSFFWPVLERQVMIKGRASKIASSVSDGYFASRPDGSKLGALVSEQSQPIPNRKLMEERLKKLEKDYEGKEIPRPQHWGGYVVAPTVMEFWQGRPNRLHDRLQYSLQENLEWKIERLQP